MEIVTQGKEYQLKTVDGKWLRVVFYHKDKDDKCDGVTSEEVLEMLINRHSHMAITSPSEENINTVTHLKQALMFIKARHLNKLRKKKHFEYKK